MKATGKKMGRPIKADAPRNKSLHLMLTEDEAQRIKDCSERLGLNRVDTIMRGIEALENQTK